jgi:hypothetical protein
VGHGASPLIAYRNARLALPRDFQAYRYVGSPLHIVPGSRSHSTFQETVWCSGIGSYDRDVSCGFPTHTHPCRFECTTRMLHTPTPALRRHGGS